MDDRDKRASVPGRILAAGGLSPGVASRVARETGVPEAEVYGIGSFFHLLADPETKVRVCTGLSCAMRGAGAVLEAARAAGMPAAECSCLAACDVAPAVLRDRRVLPGVSVEDVARAEGDWTALRSALAPGDGAWLGHVGPEGVGEGQLALNLGGEADYSGAALAAADGLGAAAVIEVLKASGLQGRGGAGFPAHIKWRAVHGAERATRHVVLNADEGEPGTFKDREVMVRRPDLVIEGLAIAARVVGAADIWLYLRGEFEIPWEAMEAAVARFESAGLTRGLTFHFHAGHGAYICGEETALLEALEGRRGMPRLKPPYPTDRGLWGEPTLVHNVETIACLPAIVTRGGAWFRGLGKTEAGTKLYCISGDVKQPGVYELPLGVSLDELVEAAGGYIGELRAFSPGGASSGFLPARFRGHALDFSAMAKAGSMLGSAGVVVLNEDAELTTAVMEQLRFFEAESCGQCAPCRIGTRLLREALGRHIAGDAATGPGALRHVAEAAWEMNEGSICGLGQAAPLPLTSAMSHFPEEFSG